MASLRSLVRPETTTVHAVSRLEMRIMPGELVGFLGPNGAGKTTTLKMLSGLIAPTAGECRVLGFTPFERDRSFLGSISLVMGQKQNLWWDLPPAETLALHREIYDIPEADFRERAEELVNMLELGDCLRIQTRKLSLGQRMRAELAVALLHRPRILFLDEPTIGLDILMQKKIRGFLLDYHARFSPTLLLTSHNMDDVAALCRRVVVINQGHTVYDGELSQLTAVARLDKILTVTFSVTPPGFDPEQYGQPVHSEGFAKDCAIGAPRPTSCVVQAGSRHQIKVSRERAPKAAAELYATGAVLDLTLEEAPLEDALHDLFVHPGTGSVTKAGQPDPATAGSAG